jgi:hypothetical protein
MAQSLYIRLLTLVDDYGRYEADPELLASEAFPYGDPQGNCCHLSAIVSSVLGLMRGGLITTYQDSEGKIYLQVLRWKERIRTESKFPDPKKCNLLTNDSKCWQMIASPPSPAPAPIKQLNSSTAKALEGNTATDREPSSVEQFSGSSAPKGAEKMNGEADFLNELGAVAGPKELENWGGRWRNRYRENSGKARRVLAELAAMAKEGKITRNAGACANDLWERFA